MSNYTPEAQTQINAAENKLGDAIANLKSQNKNNDPIIEVIPESTPDVEIALDEPAPKEPRRSEFVKTDDPKVIERINDLYGQAKKSDARNQQLIEHNKQIEDRLVEAIEKLNKLERNTQDTASNKVESELKAALRTAREEGDFDTIDSIEDKLFDLRVERRLESKIPATPIEKPIQKQNPQQQEYEAQLLKDATYMEIVSQERDAQGRLVRGYLFDGHPDNERAAQELQNVRSEFANAGKQANIKTILDVVDERIRGKKPNGQTTVLDGDNNNAPVRTTVKLTQAEINVARNMGISPERYARQKQLMS